MSYPPPPNPPPPHHQTSPPSYTGPSHSLSPSSFNGGSVAPPPPPRPTSHPASRHDTPQDGPPPPPLPPTPQTRDFDPGHAAGNGSWDGGRQLDHYQHGQQLQNQQYQYQYQQYQAQPAHGQQPPQPPSIEEQWLPEILRDYSKTDLHALLSSPELLSALTSAPSTAHPSLPSSRAPLESALTTNAALAAHLAGLASSLAQQRADLTSQLLKCRALERQWRLKQSEMDDALAAWSPKAVYSRLAAGIAEQEALVRALEESFLDGDGGGGGASVVGGGGDTGEGRYGTGGRATERETQDWIKRYREARKVLELRVERRARFDEGRVGGWR